MAKSIYDDDDQVTLVIPDDDDIFNLPKMFEGDGTDISSVPKGGEIIDKTAEIEKTIKATSKKKPIEKEEVLLSTEDDDDVIKPENDDEDEQEEPKSTSKDKKTKQSEKKVETKKDNKKAEVEAPTYELDYNPILQRLKEKEVLTIDLPENVESDEDLLNVFEQEAIAYKNDYHNYMDSKYNGLLTYLEEGGDALNFFKTVKENNYDEIEFDKIREDQTAKEKAYIDFYKTKDMDDEDIMRNMKRAKDLEEFNIEVEKIYPKLQKQSKQQKETLKKEAKEKEQKRVDQEKILYHNISSTILKSEELIPTIKLKESDKKAITKLAVSNDVFNKLSQDPVKSRILLSALAHYGILDGNWDKIIKNIETGKVKELKSQFLKNPSKGSETNVDLTNNDDDIGGSIAKSYMKTFAKR